MLLPLLFALLQSCLDTASAFTATITFKNGSYVPQIPPFVGVSSASGGTAGEQEDENPEPGMPKFG